MNKLKNYIKIWLIFPFYILFNMLEWIGLSLAVLGTKLHNISDAFIRILHVTKLINGYRTQRININIIEYEVKND